MPALPGAGSSWADRHPARLAVRLPNRNGVEPDELPAPLPEWLPRPLLPLPPPGSPPEELGNILRRARGGPADSLRLPRGGSDPAAESPALNTPPREAPLVAGPALRMPDIGGVQPPVELLLARIEASVRILTELPGLSHIQCDLHLAGFPGLSVELVSREGIVGVTLLLADPAKREELERYLPELKERLSGADLRVDGLRTALRTPTGEEGRPPRDGRGEPVDDDSLDERQGLPRREGAGRRLGPAGLVPGRSDPRT